MTTVLDELDDNSLQILYDSMKDSIIDVAAMDVSGISELKKFVYSYGRTGDLLRVNVSVNDNDFVTEAVFVEDGANIQDVSTNVFLPFEGTDCPQDVTISSSTFRYDNDKKEITLDGEAISFGRGFMVGGRRAVLAKGSVVIVFEDTLVKDFPEEGVQEEILNNDGTLALGDVTTVGVSQLERKEDSGDTSVVSYVFLHDESTDERTCVSKRTHTVDFFETGGNSLIGLGSSKSVENVVNYCASEVTLRSISSEGNESIATIDVNGLSFSSDESSIIFSEFRIKYDEPSDTIQIQYLDTTTDSYVTKREFGR